MSYHTAIACVSKKAAMKRIEPKPLQSILKKQNETNKKIRKDMNGNVIGIDSKMYSVNFKQKICQIHIVENWKKYNVLNDIIIETEPKETCLDKCSLF